MKIHFIGIGGIGVSGLASIYKKIGHEIQGSDIEESETTEEIRQQGMKVFIGHKKENLKRKIDLVVYSEAVPLNNVELREAKRLGIKCLSGAQALGELSQGYFTIAVSGMHGKSTTASMIAQILIGAGLDPTFIIGTKPGWRVGKGSAMANLSDRQNYLIIEADDFQAKFLNYHPNLLVLTNIEEEHMDYFKNLHHILRVFKRYVLQVKNYIIANSDDEGVMKVLKKIKSKSPRRSPSLSLGTLRGKQKSKPDEPKITFYSLKDREAKWLEKNLQVPGKHNISNALAALQAARALGIKDNISLKALSDYKGVWRRFERESLVVSGHKLEIISDYAHHPTEIQATLKAAKEQFPKEKIWVVFQPHQYQRTFYLFQKFVNVFKKNRFTQLVITDIYSVKGRESSLVKKRVNARKLVEAIGRPWVTYVPELKLVTYIKERVKEANVLVIMGAGNIYKLKDDLKKRHS